MKAHGIMVSAMLVIAALPEQANAAPGRAAEFTLSDQNARVHRFTFPKSKISVLVLSDHQGSSQIASWIEPLYRKYGTRIDIAGIAAIPGIPSMFHGLFRREFKKQLAYPVMLDWSGAIARRFAYAGKEAELLVLDVDGRIIFRKTGSAEPASLNSAIKAIEASLGTP
ncbi:MAG TPA: hypothetical protein VF614_06980 [Chthoniobacteraceae bacterium]|jgi:hypothetical protein